MERSRGCHSLYSPAYHGGGRVVLARGFCGSNFLTPHARSIRSRRTVGLQCGRARGAGVSQFATCKHRRETLAMMNPMTDQEFIRRFENCTLLAESFHHQDHVRLVWLYL